MIKAHLTIVNSKADIYGNRYYAIEVTNNETGKIARGTISGGESNCTYALYKMYGGWEYFSYTAKELKIRDYNKVTKYFPYMGCTEDEINSNILKQWNEEK